MSDMAMIELSQPAKLNSRVTVACLPQQGVYPRTGKECFIAGMDYILTWSSMILPKDLASALDMFQK